MIKVTVIVPIYNVINYLDECISSIVAQSMPELEIILVDDGSTDGCAKIIEQWRKSDSRIIAVHKKNEGYGAAVNVGLKMARGKYISIVEPDDYVSLDMIESLYNMAERYMVEVVKSDYYSFYGTESEIVETKNHLFAYPELYDRVLRPREEHLAFCGAIANWSGLYSRDFIQTHRIYHNESPGASFQDQGFCFLVNVFAERVYYTRKSFYHYRQDSANSSMNSKDKAYCIIQEYKYIYDELTRRGVSKKQWKSIYYERRFASFLDNLGRLASGNREEFLNCIKQEYPLDSEQVNCLTDWERERLYEMWENPSDFLFFFKRMQLANLISSNNVWIYGAGKVAKDVWELLDDNSHAQIKGFLISDGDNGTLFGKNVYPFGTVDVGKEDLIIIATGKKAAAQIRDYLERQGSWRIYEYN